ncbi:hypothetical protein Tco_0332718 [Tanacetum coccineum]
MENLFNHIARRRGLDEAEVKVVEYDCSGYESLELVVYMWIEIFTMSNRHQELASPEQTASGKDFSNPLIVDSLLKTIWFINAPCFCNEALAIPGQTATGKELSNPLMAGSLPKTTLPPKLLE